MSPHLEINKPSMYWGKNNKRSDDICGWLSLMYPHHVEKLIPTHHMSSGLKIAVKYLKLETLKKFWCNLQSSLYH